jgi:hypothetical protein
VCVGRVWAYKINGLDDNEAEKLNDPMYKLEHGVKDVKKAIEAAPVVSQIQVGAWYVSSYAYCGADIVTYIYRTSMISIGKTRMLYHKHFESGSG